MIAHSPNNKIAILNFFCFYFALLLFRFGMLEGGGYNGHKMVAAEKVLNKASFKTDSR